jgi:hypothetical protein
VHAGYVKVGHGYTHADPIQAVCTSVGPVKKNAVKKRDRDKWYGRPESLLAQTFAKILKTRNETRF